MKYSSNSSYNILVVDDLISIESRQGGLTHYDRSCFLSDCSMPGIEYDFFSGYDSNIRNYSSAAIVEHVSSLNSIPDLILLDITFGDKFNLGMDALEALTSRYPCLPVVMMTSRGKDELFDECIRKGALDYIVKPFNKESISKVIFRYLAPPKERLIGQNSALLSIVDGVFKCEGNCTLLKGDDIQLLELIAKYIERVNYRTIRYFNSEEWEESDLKNIDGNGVMIFISKIDNLNLVQQKQLLHWLKADGRKSFILAAAGSNIAEKVKKLKVSNTLYEYFLPSSFTLPALSDSVKDSRLWIDYLARTEKNKGYFVPEINNQEVVDILQLEDISNLESIANYVSTFIAFCEKNNNESLTWGSFYNDFYKINELPQQSFSNVRKKLRELRRTEFELLIISLDIASQNGGKPNKAKAAAELLNKSRASTNEFDRWLARAWKSLTPDQQSDFTPQLAERNISIKR